MLKYFLIEIDRAQELAAQLKAKTEQLSAVEFRNNQLQQELRYFIRIFFRKIYHFLGNIQKCNFYRRVRTFLYVYES